MAHVVGESNWSIGASTGSLGSTSSTPRLCTHREMYRGGGGGGGSGGGSTGIMSPQQIHNHSSPSTDSAAESPVTSWSPRDRDRHNNPLMDVAHIRLRPEIGADLPPSVPGSARECPPGGHHNHPSSSSTSPSSSSSHSANHRSVNEELDSYVVIRQRSFHGYARSKRDLRQLPQTDPREDTADSTHPDWLHRSKTDLYIERRRARLTSQRSRRRTGSGGYSLDGITLGSLVNQLPVPAKRYHDGNPKTGTSKRPTAGSPTGESGAGSAGESRFPPLTLNRMKQLIRNDIRAYGVEGAMGKTSQPPGTNNPALPASASATFPVPDAPPNSPPPATAGGEPSTAATTSKRGRRRSKALGAIPLRIWEPSLDYVLKSQSKELQPRQAVRSLANQSALRHQPSPLK